jgi:hypothetical protein
MSTTSEPSIGSAAPHSPSADVSGAVPSALGVKHLSPTDAASVAASAAAAFSASERPTRATQVSLKKLQPVTPASHHGFKLDDLIDQHFNVEYLPSKRFAYVHLQEGIDHLRWFYEGTLIFPLVAGMIVFASLKNASYFVPSKKN